MLKGVTKRIVEIRSPASDYFERAVLYLRADKPLPKSADAGELAEEYLKTLEPENHPRAGRDARVTVAVLSLCLGVSLAAVAVLLILCTKL